VNPGLVGDLLFYQRRAHVGGADRVGGDTAGAALERDRLGQALQAVLGRDVGALVRRGAQAVHGGDVIDPADARRGIPLCVPEPRHLGRCTVTRRQLGLASGGQAPGLGVVDAVDHPGGVTIGPASGVGNSNAFGLVVCMPCMSCWTTGHEVDQRRKQAMQALGDVQQFITQALAIVEAGQWTAHEDLAELVGTNAAEVANFLASFKIQIPNAFRALNADGTIPAEGMLHASYRGTDLRKRLALEGVEFDAAGRAAQDRRLTAQDLKGLLDELRASDGVISPTAKRAWMVRGTNIDGYNLVPDWLADGFVSLSASQLGHLDTGISFDALRQAVEIAYQHKSYAYRGQRLDELDRFIRRMSVGDLVLTPMQGSVYLGEVTSGPRFDGDGTLAGFRRAVAWHDRGHPVDVSGLPAPIPALLQSQAYVVDLTEACDQLAALIPGKPTEAAGTVPEIKKEQRTLGFNPVTAAAAAGLLMDVDELQKIADLLWERKQLRSSASCTSCLSTGTRRSRCSTPPRRSSPSRRTCSSSAR